ncbi:hypothetical protein DK842_03890 [Chromobacterium phragmitis]|nr:hypothetical protein DK842_03890 [Chromobacterium phragmitis]
MKGIFYLFIFTPFMKWRSTRLNSWLRRTTGLKSLLRCMRRLLKFYCRISMNERNTMSNLQLSGFMVKPSNGLSRQQIVVLQTVLLRYREASLQALQETQDHLQAFLEISDSEERSLQREEYRVDLTVQEHEKLQLQRIEQALQRIRNGSYGYCEFSGEPIGMARLMVRPTATLSKDAQETAEES